MTTADPPIAHARLAAPDVRRPASLADAVRDLRELGSTGAPLAGGSWIMRAPLRREQLVSVYVALSGLDELRGIETQDGAVSIGALVTHNELGALDGPAAVAGLVTAAARSAFPAVRSVATVGGNLASIGFPEADLVPALLATEARVELVSPDGETTQDVAAYLATRASRPAGELIARVVVPAPAARRSGFERLTIRGRAEYAVASVAVSVTLDGDVVSDARVAVGSVEEQARLCPGAAEVLVGSRLDAAAGERAGQVAAQECTGRDGLDAPGWYRLAVLPALTRRLVAGLVGEEN